MHAKSEPGLLDKGTNMIVYCNCLAEIAIGAILAILLSVEVVCRYVFNSSLIFSEELSRMLFIWFGMLGATVALHEGAHIGFDIIKNRFQGIWAKAVSILTSLVILVYSAFIMYGCIMILPSQTIQMYASLKISIFWSYLSVAVGMAFLMLRVLYTLICLVGNRKENTLSVEEMFGQGRRAGQC